MIFKKICGNHQKKSASIPEKNILPIHQTTYLSTALTDLPTEI